MVDQEGGRVARLRPPHWAAHPAAGVIGALYKRHAGSGAAGGLAAWRRHWGRMPRLPGFDMVAAPVLDLGRAGPGSPSSATGVSVTIRLPWRSLGLRWRRAGGRWRDRRRQTCPGPWPGAVDSHLGLPRVAAQGPGWAADIAPFRQTAGRIPCMMTAHILYEGLDDIRPATLSRSSSSPSSDRRSASRAAAVG